MSDHPLVYCTAPWASTPHREPEAEQPERRCDRCNARLRRRQDDATRCDPCQHATTHDPEPAYCQCGCGAEVWMDRKGRGGIYMQGHNPSKRGSPTPPVVDAPGPETARYLESQPPLKEKAA